LLRLTWNVPSALIAQTVPNGFVHVPTSAFCGASWNIAHPPRSATTVTAKTTEIDLFMVRYCREVAIFSSQNGSSLLARVAAYIPVMSISEEQVRDALRSVR